MRFTRGGWIIALMILAGIVAWTMTSSRRDGWIPALADTGVPLLTAWLIVGPLGRPVLVARLRSRRRVFEPGAPTLAPARREWILLAALIGVTGYGDAALFALSGRADWSFSRDGSAWSYPVALLIAGGILELFTAMALRAEGRHRRYAAAFEPHGWVLRTLRRTEGEPMSVSTYGIAPAGTSRVEPYGIE